MAIAFDRFDNVYFTDHNNHRVRKIDVTTGIITTVAGNGGIGYGSDGVPATSTTIYNPYGICIDGIGNIFVSDYSNYRIRKVDTFGIISTYAGTGSPGYGIDGIPATSSNIYQVYGLCADRMNNIYICDGARVRRIDAITNIITTFAGNGTSISGGDGGPATNAGVNPLAIAMNATGELFIGDQTANDVRKVDVMGIMHTVAGNGLTGFSGDGVPATATSIWSTRGVAVDTSGNLYISDNGNARIRKVTYSLPVVPSVSITAMPGDTVFTGTTSIFTAIPNGLILPTYKWIVNGSLVSTLGNTYSYIPSSGDSIRCIVTSGSDCYGISVLISNTINMVVKSNVVAPVYHQTQNASFYPNPATHTITIENALGGYLVLYDAVGREVMNIEINSHNQVVDISRLMVGVYVVKITDNEGRKVVKRLIKE